MSKHLDVRQTGTGRGGINLESQSTATARRLAEDPELRRMYLKERAAMKRKPTADQLLRAIHRAGYDLHVSSDQSEGDVEATADGGGRCVEATAKSLTAALADLLRQIKESDRG